MKMSRVGLDLAKSVIQVHAVDRSGAAVVRKALKHAQLLPFIRDLPPCEVGMEACASAHHWGRQLQSRTSVSVDVCARAHPIQTGS
jgi:transposase